MSFYSEYRYDSGFALLAGNLENALKQYPKIKKSESLALQKAQMEELINLEQLWKEKLLKTDYWEDVYFYFWNHIMHTLHSIALARVYFRERQKTFSGFICGAFNSRDLATLAKYHGNYQQISLMVKSGLIKDQELLDLAIKIRDLRNKIIEMNLPLAISRSRIFWSKTPEFHLSHMDLIQLAVEGLISAIDKFCLPFTSIFRGVIISRVSGAHISNYSETLIHFYPIDKKKLYRANKLVHGFSIIPGKSIDFVGLSNAINKKYDDGCKTTPEEVYNLLSSCASQFVELADKVLDDKKPKNIDNKISTENNVKYSVLSIDEQQFPENIVEKELMHESLQKASADLNILERKLLKCMGITI